MYHHGIPTKDPHKAVVKALKVMDRRASITWANHVSVGLSLVLWGTELKNCEYRQKMAATKARHEALKAAGTWVERNLKFDY